MSEFVKFFGEATVEVENGHLTLVEGMLDENFLWIIQNDFPGGTLENWGDNPDLYVAEQLERKYGAEVKIPVIPTEIDNAQGETKAYNPDQKRWPEGHPDGGQWMPEGDVDLLNAIWKKIGPYSADSVDDLESLEAFALTADFRTEQTWAYRDETKPGNFGERESDIPAEISGVGIFNHATKRDSELDLVVKVGIRGREKIWASQELIRDRSGGVVFFHAKGLEPKAGTDYVSEDLTYPEYTFPGVPAGNIVKVLREIKIGTGGHSIREDHLAKYAVANQGMTGPEVTSLPKKYQKWFNLAGSSKAYEYRDSQPRYPKGHPKGGQWMPTERYEGYSSPPDADQVAEDLLDASVQSEIFDSFDLPTDHAEVSAMPAKEFQDKLEVQWIKDEAYLEDAVEAIRAKVFFPSEGIQETIPGLLNEGKTPGWAFLDRDLVSRYNQFFQQWDLKNVKMESQLKDARANVQVTLDYATGMEADFIRIVELGKQGNPNWTAELEDFALSQWTTATNDSWVEIEKANKLEKKYHSFRHSKLWRGIIGIMGIPASEKAKGLKPDYVITKGAKVQKNRLKTLRDEIKKAFSIVGQAVHREIVPGDMDFNGKLNNVPITIYGDNQGRAQYSHDKGLELYVEASKYRTVVHEFGHYLEENDWKLQEYADAFRRYRGRYERFRTLDELGGWGKYRKDEIAQRDEWPSAYSGKFYGPKGRKNDPSVHWGTWSTEVTSMGVERFLEDPYDFWKADSEYFLWTATVLSNQFQKYVMPTHDYYRATPFGIEQNMKDAAYRKKKKVNYGN